MYHLLKCFHRQALVHAHAHPHPRPPTQSLPFHDGFADGSGSGEAQFTDIRMFRESLTHHRACSRHNQSITYSIHFSIHQPSIKQLMDDNLLYTVWDITFFSRNSRFCTSTCTHWQTTFFWMMGMCNSLRIPSVNTTQHGGQIKSLSYWNCWRQGLLDSSMESSIAMAPNK